MNNVLRALIVFILFPLDLFSQETEVPAETIPIAYIILDASSSMWGRIDDRPKIELAKDVITKVVNGLPQKVNAGFTVYGHRRAEDCKDIEDISALGILDKKSIFEKLKNITPRGKSPLTDAISHVIDKVKDLEGPKTIILISDGVESCGKDPCKLIKELKANNINFKIEVIGLNVSESETEQLKCIAEESGGAYQYITSAAQINPPPPTATPLSIIENTIPIISAPTYALATATPDSITLINKVPTPYTALADRGRGEIIFEHDNWLIRPFYWRLIDPNTGEEIVRSRDFEQKDVPEGSYVLAWRQYEHGSTEVIIDYEVIIKAGKTTELPLYTAIRLNLPNWIKPPRFWGLQDAETLEQVAAFTPFETFLVAPGYYELIWRQYENRADTLSFGKIEIAEGKVNYININTSITPQFAEWVNTKPYYWGLKVPDSPDYIARFYGSIEKQIIPEGRYDVVYRLAANDSTDSVLGTIDVLDGENSDFIIDSGITFEIKDNSNLPQTIVFDQIDDTDKTIKSVRISNSTGPIPLKPGRYRINYVTSEQKTKGSFDSGDIIDLKQGELIKINLDDLFHNTSVEKATIPAAIINFTQEEASAISQESESEQTEQDTSTNAISADEIKQEN